VRWPPKALDLSALGDANTVSLVLRVDWEDRQLWLMGDALGVQERDLMELGDPGFFQGFRVLKLGHHGSRSSSDPAWIRALHPGLSLATAGRRNRFGHPHAETLATFAAQGLPAPLLVGGRRGLRIQAVPGGWDVTGGDGLYETVRNPANPAPAGAR
jgi:competence protein ComEC